MYTPIQNRDQERLTLLVRAGEIFHQSLDLAATLNNVARLAVESFSDICLFDLLDERADRLFVTAAAHRDPEKEASLAVVPSILYVEEFRVHPVVRVTQTGEPFFVPVMDDETMRSHAASRAHERFMRENDYGSKIVVPVTAQDFIFGALTFVRTRDHEAFGQPDLLFAIELGRRAGLAVANAKQFLRERNVAETLQRAFLPVNFPEWPGIRFNAHYRPGSSEADIGGDWYDAFDIAGDKVLVTIGDVTGKGVDAARLMVLMRQAIRIAALDSDDPAKIAETCNRLMFSEQGDRLASTFLGVLDPRTRKLTYVSAGHAPPFVRLADGTVKSLESPSMPLGAFNNAEFECYSTVLAEGSMLIMYTDGIIENTHDVIAGTEMLEKLIASTALMHSRSPAEFIERTIADAAPRDDIAIMVVTFGKRAIRWQFEAEDARTAYSMRDGFFRALQEFSEGDEAAVSQCATIFAELIGNAVRHAPGPLSVALETRGSELVLHVVDRGPGFHYRPRLPEDVWAESGRGLFLITALSRSVEVTPVPGRGTHVAVTLPLDVRADAVTL